jgi:hypothetical protein
MKSHWFYWLVIGGVLATGCSQHPNASSLIEQMNDSNGKRLANLYSVYQARHNFTGPNNRAAFVKFIQQGILPSELEGTGVDPNAIDDLFTSERDGEPFFIRYGVVAPSWGVSHQAVVFEENGSGGGVAVFMTGPKRIEVAKDEVMAYRNGDKDELPDKPLVAPPPGEKG